jgi:hypothetical protein
MLLPPQNLQKPPPTTTTTTKTKSSLRTNQNARLSPMQSRKDKYNINSHLLPVALQTNYDIGVQTLATQHLRNQVCRRKDEEQQCQWRERERVPT